MPVYEYQCTACQHEFEREQRISEAAVKKCPKCGKAKAKRLISRTSFVLKGGGLYGDLYASQKPASESKTEADASKKSDGAAAAETKSEPAKAETKTESKPEKKSKGKKAAA